MYGRGHQTVSFGPPVTPNVIKQLLIANLAVFVAQALFPLLWQLGPVTPYRFWHEGYLWQPFTYMFLHGDILHYDGVRWSRMTSPTFNGLNGIDYFIERSFFIIYRDDNGQSAILF